MCLDGNGISIYKKRKNPPSESLKIKVAFLLWLKCLFEKQNILTLNLTVYLRVSLSGPGSVPSHYPNYWTGGMMTSELREAFKTFYTINFINPKCSLVESNFISLKFSTTCLNAFQAKLRYLGGFTKACFW